ncbi:lysosomal acid phosphatase-like [Haliotis rufescens]|uniref:lysosomal acid phosphatase-like n=1 Tax=Haliotis rufescens TaxID=6454 RepID=UPI00201F9826|nr:lysosomal acid phosphatase-like [Haliotis rufescens]
MEEQSVAVVALILVVGCFSVDTTAPTTLRLVNLMYRHGDRTPYTTYPNNPHSMNTTWPQGLQWLTTDGMAQLYSLGRFLRRRYSGFLSNKYMHTEITVESSDVDRCLMSAYSNLAGLYPPSGDQVWNSNIPWQPIPVHTRPKVEDNMLALHKPCPKYDMLYDLRFSSPQVHRVERENKGFFRFLEEKSGLTPVSFKNLWEISDTLFCEKNHNVTLPSWVNSTIYQKLREFEAVGYDLLYNGTIEARLNGGPLLKKWIELAQRKLSSKSYTTKMNMFSAHDSTTVALLCALRVHNHLNPPYSSAVLMELHETGAGVFHVELYYRNVSSTDPNDDTQPNQLTIPGCTSQCPLTNFVSLTKDMVPTDWDAECAASNTDPIIGRRRGKASRTRTYGPY